MKKSMMCFFVLCLTLVFSIINVFAASYTVKLNKPSYNPASDIAVTVSGFSEAELENEPSIGIYKTGASFDDYEYSPDSIYEQNQQIELTAPDEPGKYELRLFKNQDLNNSTLISRTPFEVKYHSEGNLTFSLNKNTFEEYEDITVNIKGYHDSMDEREPLIALYKVSALNDDYESTVDIAKDTTTETFQAPNEAGNYEFRMFFYDVGMYTLISKTPITVKAAKEESNNATYQVTQSKNPNVPDRVEKIPNISSTLSLSASVVKDASKDAGVYLSWNSVSQTNRFLVYRSEKSGSFDKPITSEISANSFIDINIDPNKTYYYMVKPMMSLTETGQASNEAIVKTGSVIEKTGNASKRGYILMKVDSPQMVVNGVYAEVDPGKTTAPINLGSRVVVPIRAVVEAMGGKVSWNDKLKQATLTVGTDNVLMTINSKDYKLNGKTYSMDVSAQIINERTMIPLRYSAEALKSKVVWIAPSNEILIIYNKR